MPLRPARILQLTLIFTRGTPGSMDQVEVAVGIGLLALIAHDQRMTSYKNRTERQIRDLEERHRSEMAEMDRVVRSQRQRVSSLEEENRRLRDENSAMSAGAGDGPDGAVPGGGSAGQASQ